MPRPDELAFILRAESRRIHQPNAHTTQPPNFIFGDLNATTLKKNTIFVIIRIFFIFCEVFGIF